MMENMMENKETALIVVDMQNDFMSFGKNAIADANSLIAPINQLIEYYDNVIMTQDWHPKNHISFNLWPPHCIMGSFGAEIHKDINKEKAQLILRKGFNYNKESYSAFFEEDNITSTGLSGYLRDRNIKNLIFCGLALDFCVGYSALDGAKLGFNCTIILNCCRAIDKDNSLQQMLQKLQAQKVQMLLGA